MPTLRRHIGLSVTRCATDPGAVRFGYSGASLLRPVPLVLLRRITTLGRALVGIGGLVLSVLGAPAHAAVDTTDGTFSANPPAAVGHIATAPAVHEHACQQQTSSDTEPSAIESREDGPALDLLGGKLTELVTLDVRPTVHSRVGDFGRSKASLALSGYDAAAARGWCDVVQCRRLGGAHILGFATPPPSRR